MMRRLLTACTLLFVLTTVMAQHRTFDPQVKSLQVIVNNDWLSPPVLTLGNHEVMTVCFDRLTHEYCQYSYHLEHCEADWSTSEEIFESNWLQGFNDQPIDDYETSINTTVPYTHYSLCLPNELTQLKISGNYRLSIIDEDGEVAVEVRFMVLEPLMQVAMAATTNTDIDVNHNHQQLSMKLNYGPANVTNVEEQLYTVVTQNQRWENAVRNPAPNMRNQNGLQWDHNRALIFDAGNEYHKFEILDVSHTTMGLSNISWDGEAYNAYPYSDEPRRNYLTDEDADGAFIIRNSDNIEINTTCDYVRVHYELRTPPLPDDVVISGQWTTDADPAAYQMEYDHEAHCYRATIWQKQGYYNYQYRLRHRDGSTTIAPTEGSYYQASNSYQAYIYYKGIGERTWRLVGYRQLVFR